MPWKITRNGEEHCVYKESGELEACHKTRAEAVAHMKALYASEGVKKSLLELEKCFYSEPFLYAATSFAEAEKIEEAYHKQMEVNKLFNQYLDIAHYILYGYEVEDRIGKLDNLTKELSARVQMSSEMEHEMEEEDVEKAVWDSAYQSELPDSAFMYIEPNSEKDETGRTTPRSKRHFPIKDKEDQHDMAHVRNAIQRIPQSNAPGLTPEKKESLQNKARKILASLNKSMWRLHTCPQKKLVYGLFRVPGPVDSPNDVIDDAQIERAAHEFFRKSRILDHQHKEDLPPNIAEPVESYVMPTTVNVGGKIIKRGSWILVSKIHDSGLWEKIQRGELLSYSIRGIGKREPITLPEEEELVPA